MRAIVMMFDSLNRHFLPNYGAKLFDLPNFARLATKTTTFSRCYAGSMPCMPARREMHTGRYNFLHRGWGPLEPFDDSVPQMLGENGVYTHLVTDHQHYWEDGGATYHNRYSSFEFIRGQEGDPWKGHVADPDIPKTLSWRTGAVWRQDWINRQYMRELSQHCQTRTFDAGLEFIDTNAQADNWLLQIECFDPHEPFFSSDEHRERVGDSYEGEHFDWPDYRPMLEDDAAVEHLRKGYGALLTMCDDSLGRLLDRMDASDMWKDTVLIVCTDHGFLLGEHEWYGKNVQPWYEENIHTPLMIYDPRSTTGGTMHEALVQTVDLPVTLLDVFGLKPTADMHGKSLLPLMREGGSSVREAGLFGIFGGHVSVTDGQYVYMRACASPANRPLDEFTLMPTRMKSRYSVDELAGVDLAPGFAFTKGLPVLRTRGLAFGNPYHFGTLLYDLVTDPGQTNPLNDAALELKMTRLLVRMMRENNAPEGQYERLGLPAEGEVTEAHLLIAEQWQQVEATQNRNWREVSADGFGAIGALSLRQARADAAIQARVEDVFGMPLSAPLLNRFGDLTLWQLATMTPAMTPEKLRSLDREFSTHGRAINALNGVDA